MSASALYVGRVHHRRAGVDSRSHAFSKRMHLLYLDLDELPELLGGRLIARRPGLARFRRADYLAPAERPLKAAVLDRIEAELGRRPAGPVRVLTQPRTLGYLFNPVSFYYAFDEAGDEGGALDAVVAEITNTPWNERHAYVLDARGQGELRWRFPKRFHVSPFFDLDHEYEWRLVPPGERLRVDMTNWRAGQRLFDAGLACERRELTRSSLAAALLRYPLQPLQAHAAIYLHALLLWIKRTPFYPHPSKRAPGAPDIQGTSATRSSSS